MGLNPIVSGIILLGIMLANPGCVLEEPANPEKTIRTYFESYRRGDKAMVLSTMSQGEQISLLGLGRHEEHEIIENTRVLTPSHP